MGVFEFATRVEAHASASHDRAEFWDFGAYAVACLADGAGVMSGAAVAADAWMALARDFAASHGGPPDGVAWCRCLAEADVRLYGNGAAGKTTAVVVTVTADGLLGASVGDSGAWLYRPAGAEELTARQRIRPLLGSGGAVPESFAVRGRGGTLLLATDGLWRYAPPVDLADVMAWTDLATVARAAVDRARLPSGSLQDDVGLVLCRRTG